MSIRLMIKKTNAREKYGNPSMAMSAAVLSGLTNKPTRMCGNKMNAAVVTMPQITEVNNAIRFVSAHALFLSKPEVITDDGLC